MSKLFNVAIDLNGTPGYTRERVFQIRFASSSVRTLCKNGLSFKCSLFRTKLGLFVCIRKTIGCVAKYWYCYEGLLLSNVQENNINTTSEIVL